MFQPPILRTRAELVGKYSVLARRFYLSLPLCLFAWSLSVLERFVGPMWNSAENVFARTASFREDGEDEEALRWAALERLPTYNRVRRGIFRDMVGDSKEIDVSELETGEQKLLLDRLISSVDDDPERFFDRMRRRFDA